MRLFQPKTIGAWFVLVFWFCWEFLGAWARIEFVFNKLRPGEPMIPILSAIAQSRLFSFALLLAGLAWLWWTTRPRGQMKDDSFILLKDAVQQLYNKCITRPVCSRFLEEHIKGEFTTRNEVWGVIAGHFVDNSSINIYGKDKYSSELIKIDKSNFGSMYFDNEAFDLCRIDGKEPIYTEISVKKDKVEKAITEIIELTEGIYKTKPKRIMPAGGPILEIIKAHYWTPKEGIDVTEELQNLIIGNKLETIASNDIKGDPDVGTVKTLSIEYKINGKTLRKDFTEGQMVILP